MREASRGVRLLGVLVAALALAAGTGGCDPPDRRFIPDEDFYRDAGEPEAIPPCRHPECKCTTCFARCLCFDGGIDPCLQACGLRRLGPGDGASDRDRQSPASVDHGVRSIVEGRGLAGSHSTAPPKQ